MGWKGMDDFEPENKSLNLYSCKISVVISCRNEEGNLPTLLTALANQTYKDFELILMNDHSTDNTEAIILDSKDRFSDLVYVKSEQRGKKLALSEGIIPAKGELIITTDADCMPEPTWVETILKFYLENPSHMIICPVKMPGGKTLFTRVQQLEFITLIASGAGMAGAGMPIMANAANMAFTKEAWLKSRKDLKPEEQSGDDIFLLQSIKKRGGIIRFLRSKKAFTSTLPVKNIKAFFRQRRRWAGKSTAYTDWHLIFTACVVFGICLMQLLLLIWGIADKLYLYFFVFFFLLKYMYDTKFLLDVSDFFSLKSVPLYSFCLSVIYPFYIVITALSALFFKPRKWN